MPEKMVSVGLGSNMEYEYSYFNLQQYELLLVLIVVMVEPLLRISADVGLLEFFFQCTSYIRSCLLANHFTDFCIELHYPMVHAFIECRIPYKLISNSTFFVLAN